MNDYPFTDNRWEELSSINGCRLSLKVSSFAAVFTARRRQPAPTLPVSHRNPPPPHPLLPFQQPTPGTGADRCSLSLNQLTVYCKAGCFSVIYYLQFNEHLYPLNCFRYRPTVPLYCTCYSDIKDSVARDFSSGIDIKPRQMGL